MDPVKILSYGLSGLVFLLVFFAYQLLSNEQKRDKPRTIMIVTIMVFMLINIASTVIVGVWGIPSMRDNQKLSDEKDKALNDKKNTDKVNDVLQTANKTKDGFIKTLSDTSAINTTVLVAQLQTTAKHLDTLSTSIAKVDTKSKASIDNINKSLKIDETLLINHDKAATQVYKTKMYKAKLATYNEQLNGVLNKSLSMQK